MPTSAELTELAMAIRSHYCAAVRRHYEQRTGKRSTYGQSRLPKWDGGRDSQGRTHTPLWPKVAAYCHEAGIHPDRLVRVLFLNVVREEPPWPTQLLSADTLQRYRLYLASEMDRLRNERNTQQQAFRYATYRYVTMFGKTPELAAKLVLVDTEHGWSPVFAFTVAKSLGLDDVASEWKEAAAYEYLFDAVLYDKLYDGKVPAALKQAAEKIRQRLFDD